MTQRTCSEQPDVLAAAAAGPTLPPQLASHLASCPSCREQREAVIFLCGLADTTDARHPLPDPAVVWWKGQLARRWQAERAAAAPLERMRWVELAAGVASLVAFLVWQWQSLADLAARAIPASMTAAAAASRTATPTSLILVLCGTASVAAMILAAFHRRLGGQST